MTSTPAGRPEPVAGRIVTWALILFGAAEIPWVMYLAFNQAQVTQAFHVKAATLGLGSLSAALCFAAAWTIVRRSSWAPALCVAAATTLAFLSTVGKLTPSLETSGLLGTGQSPLLVALPGVLAAALAARATLTGTAPVGVRTASPLSGGLRAAAGVLAVTGVVVATRMVLHVLQWDSTALATHTRGIVVILDTFEVVGLLGAGLASLTGRVRSTLVLATIACSLLVCDAFGNVAMTTGQAFTAALIFLVVGEIPSIVVCALAIRAAHRRLTPTLESQPGAMTA